MAKKKEQQSVRVLVGERRENPVGKYLPPKKVKAKAKPKAKPAVKKPKKKGKK